MSRHLATVHGYTGAMIETYRSNNNFLPKNSKGHAGSQGTLGVRQSTNPIVRLLHGTHIDYRDNSGTDITSHPLSDGYYQDGLLTPHFVNIAGRMHPKDYYNIETAEGRKNRLRLNNCLY